MKTKCPKSSAERRSKFRNAKCGVGWYDHDQFPILKFTAFSQPADIFNLMDRIVILPNGKPSISTRVSISWPPAPPAEDSSVLVLSSCPYKSKSDSIAPPFLLYLDLRLSLPLSPSSKITWAFAGIRHTLQLNPHPRFRWDHIIDSRNGMEGSDTVDEGETVVSHNHEVETGIGWNPETNRVERYEELWRYRFILGPLVDGTSDWTSVKRLWHLDNTTHFLPSMKILRNPMRS
jgi:hypothetical protein